MACLGCKKPNPSNHPSLPSTGKLVWNFMHSLKRLIFNGTRYVTPSELERRLKICEGCDLRVDNRCGHPDCGCYLDIIPHEVPIIGGAPGRAQYVELDCPFRSEEFPNGKWGDRVVTRQDLRPRHLLYHILPISKNGVWQHNVELLLQRIEQFDGKRIVAIVFDQACDPVDCVKEAFSSTRIDEFLIMVNNPNLREVVTWNSLWEKVADQPGITFYGHAKGVTRPWNEKSSIGPWTEMMYRELLDDPQMIEDELLKFQTFGVAKKLGRGFTGEVISSSLWHYTGTFFWVRNCDLGDKWKTIDRNKYGNESWVGVHYPQEKAGAIVTGQIHELDMYRLETVQRVLSEIEAWKSQRELTHSKAG